MENKTFIDYKIANLSNNDKTQISELETLLCTKSGKEIVLIAYEPKVEA